ncbi:MAG: PD40 domain-containing protein [Paludibacteraceae bacterium]|nr:PD40 domain-containing protein [Paludibacteraceae bacterium]
MINKITKIIGCMVMGITMTACESSIPSNYSETTDSLMTYPDYQNITIPSNVMPLNFMVLNEGDKSIAQLTSESGESIVSESAGKIIKFSPKEWNDFLQRHTNEKIKVDVYVQNESQWNHFPSYQLMISSDFIDKYITYRWIEPSYESTGNIGIYQYDLETGMIKTLADNHLFKSDPSFGLAQTCMNCHNKQRNNPENSVFQFRAQGGGMLVTYNGETKVISTKVGDMEMPAIYERWHPSLPLIVFSNNTVRQMFGSRDPNKIEAFDWRSDILQYDIVKNEISYIIKTKGQSETYPIWSADGKYLYYCSSDTLFKIDKYKSMKYDLMRIPFDEQSMSWGAPERIYNASGNNKSVSKPQVSPDNQYIAMTISEYGAYHYTHIDSDVYLLNLTTHECKPIEALNSPQAEGYVTWSSNGRWLMVGSRKEDGSYARLYLSYFDTTGTAHKAFQLPHEDPLFDKNLLKNYNYPEFGTVDVKYTASDIYKILEDNAPVIPSYKGDMEKTDGNTGASIIKYE